MPTSLQLSRHPVVLPRPSGGLDDHAGIVTDWTNHRNRVHWKLDKALERAELGLQDPADGEDIQGVITQLRSDLDTAEDQIWAWSHPWWHRLLFGRRGS